MAKGDWHTCEWIDCDDVAVVYVAHKETGAILGWFCWPHHDQAVEPLDAEKHR